jgi:hypothetical protein
MTDARLETWLRREYGAAPATQELIATAMLFWRRRREATARLDEEGLTVQPKKGLFRHPLVAVERECQLGFLRTLAALDLQARRGRRSGGATKTEQLPPARMSGPGEQYLAHGA